MRKKTKRKLIRISFVALAIIMVTGIFTGIIFLMNNNKGIEKIQNFCKNLDESANLGNVTNKISNIIYQIEIPEYMFSEESKNGIYYYSTDDKNLKPALYLYLYYSDEIKTFNETYKEHLENKNLYDFQEIKNNNKTGFYIESKNIEDAQNIMTIQHLDICGNHFEFSCAYFCPEKRETCAEIFDSLRLKCEDGEWLK